jgi:hypothetical protein
MNEITIKLSTGQVALVLELLKPYAELSLQLSNQYRVQTNAGAMVGAVKAEKIEKTEVKNG